MLSGVEYEKSFVTSGPEIGPAIITVILKAWIKDFQADFPHLRS